MTSEFCAAHSITIAGKPEAVHGHNFAVELTVAGSELDDDGLLCDFHALEAALGRVLDPLSNTNLNATAPFDSLNPTAEHIARHIALGVQAQLVDMLPTGAGVCTCTITEAPGCKATCILESSTRTPAHAKQP